MNRLLKIEKGTLYDKESMSSKISRSYCIVFGEIISLVSLKYKVDNQVMMRDRIIKIGWDQVKSDVKF